ncbi:hypothetical protein CUS_5928 [Ruminococcus albus 8]|uniref:Uncharacterized protein n=1 Tax=Ruminococcus albus 8 TaxID=246199 RepID=E9SE98_RUMAL|nr:hypothetical protein CUS_5928 [Ruminococcus albus 8]
MELPQGFSDMIARCAAAAPVLSANFVLWNTLEKGQVNHFPLPFVQP